MPVEMAEVIVAKGALLEPFEVARYT